ncbi:MAG: signal peptidase II [Candidatus Protochlamydia sp.]|nr:signal peptidase II [Candidatus Protochlamydia sp.]
MESCWFFSQKSRLGLQVFWIGLAVLFLDQLSKFIVYSFIPLMDASTYWYPYGGIGIFQDFLGIEFSINHMTNKGAAWGLFGNYQFPLLIFRMGLIGGLAIYLVRFNHRFSWQIPLVLVLAGAIGNVLDYFFYGHVVDMLHFVLWGYDFPVFNLADCAITIGISSLFLLSWFEK